MFFFCSRVSKLFGAQGSPSSSSLLYVRLYEGPDIKLFILVGWGRSFLSVAWPTGVQLVFFFCSRVSKLFGAQGSPSSGSLFCYRLYDGPDIKLFILVGWGWSLLSVACATGVQLVYSFAPGFGAQGSPSSGSLLHL